MMDLDYVQSLIKALDESGLDSIEIERGGTRIRLARTPSGVAGAALAVQAGSAPSFAAPGAATDASGAPAAAPPASPAGHVPAPETDSAGSGLLEINSPMVGTFYRSPAPDAPSYVDLGATVTPGETLCIIEAMKLMNELECEISGVIREICVENGEPVEFGQVLFRVSP
jgi:acetyl-CoA carboxylase biotin carboxyl carrier protein